MSNRSAVNQKTQLGLETVFGTIVPATRRMPNLSLMPYPEMPTTAYRGQGFKYPSSQVAGMEMTKFTFDGAASYGELAYVLSGLLSACTPTAVGTGGYQWAFQHSISNPDTPSTFTMEHGDPNFGANFGYGLFDGMNLNIARDTIKISGTGSGQKWNKGVSLTAVNAVQTITMSGSPTGGTFTLTYQGATTANIPEAATATQVQAALQLLPTIGAGNITCTGGPFPATPIVATGAGNLAGMALGLISATGGGLTPSGTVTVTQTTAGLPSIVEDVPIAGGQASVFLDSTFAAIGTTQLLADYTLALALTGRWGVTKPINGALPSHGGHVELVPKASLKLEIMADAVNDAFIDQIRGGGTKYLQVKCTGPTFTGAGYSFILNVPFQVEKSNALKELEGVYVADWDLAPVADPIANYALNAVLINKTATL